MKTYIMIEAAHDRAVVGLWCERCLKPSAVKVPILAITEEGVNECGSFEGCMDCWEEGPYGGQGEQELDCG
jgi:hypothetical protein